MHHNGFNIDSQPRTCGSLERDFCRCGCRGQGGFMSRKKKIEALEQYASELEEKAKDVREYVKELGNPGGKS